MAIKIHSEDSDIRVKTFVDAPETADIDIVNKGTKIEAEVMLKISPVESAYSTLGINPSHLSEDQLFQLLNKIIETKSSGQSIDKGSILEWANAAASFVTIAGSETLTSAISSVCEFATNKYEVLQEIFNNITR